MMQLIAKEKLMKLVAAGHLHETFEHSVEGHFDITAMRAWAAANCQILHANVAMVLEHAKTSRVWEQERVDSMDARSYTYDPALFVQYIRPEGETHLMIDGVHRLIRRAQEGQENFPFYLIPEANIIRPDLTLFARTDEIFGVDWGDDLVNGEIIKRGAK